MAGVEMLPSSSEQNFTNVQLANFKQAFGVFDVNKDGRISTQEIFEVLTTMGNTVSPEREKKIREAVSSVDVDGTGNLDFNQFIKFMQIMDRHNKEEAQERMKEEDARKYNEVALLRYAKWCVTIDIRLRRSSNTFRVILVNFLFLALLVHAIGVGVLIAIGVTFWDQNPADENNDLTNNWGQVVRYLRYANYVNFLGVVIMLTDPHKIKGIKEVLQWFPFRCVQTDLNAVKYALRRCFLVNVAANVLLILGKPGFVFSTAFIEAEALFLWIPFAQIVATFFIYSPYFVFETHVVPASWADWLKVFFCDLFFYNWFRLVWSAIKNVIFVAVFLPALIVYSIAFLFSLCCCRDLFNTEDEHSKTSKFLFWAGYFCG